MLCRKAETGGRENYDDPYAQGYNVFSQFTHPWLMRGIRKASTAAADGLRSIGSAGNRKLTTYKVKQKGEKP